MGVDRVVLTRASRNMATAVAVMIMASLVPFKYSCSGSSADLAGSPAEAFLNSVEGDSGVFSELGSGVISLSR